MRVDLITSLDTRRSTSCVAAAVRSLGSPIAVTIGRWLLAIVFVMAALPKLRQPEDFAVAVHNYRLLPTAMVGAVAVMLPGVEGVAALGLLTRRWRFASACIVATLSAVFVTSVVFAIARGLDINCGCFSVLVQRKVGYTLLAQDIVLLIAAVSVATKTS